MTLKTSYPGDTDVSVYKSSRHKEPHFIISGACVEDLDKTKIREYLDGCDWSDKDSPGWITPRVRCDDFLKSQAPNKPLTKRQIADALCKHLDDEGTLNDTETDSLYRQWHNLTEDEETDLEEVENWAVETAGKARK